MKKLIENNGITYFEFQYEGYTAKFIVVNDYITDMILYNSCNVEQVNAPVYNDKYPMGLPITSYYKRKLKAEVIEIVNEMIDIKDAILNGDESVIDEILV